MANHGYLPRNGFIGLLDAVAASRKVFGMGEDLGTILSAYGGLIDGAVVGWSIGGGIHTGIGGSHNNYESDSSPLRGDLYQYGSNTALVMSQFKEVRVPPIAFSTCLNTGLCSCTTCSLMQQLQTTISTSCESSARTDSLKV
jgi:hypothetical protein